MTTELRRRQITSATEGENGKGDKTSPKAEVPAASKKRRSSTSNTEKILFKIPVILFYAFWFIFGILVLRKTQNAIAAVRYVKRHGHTVAQEIIENSREFDDLIQMLDEEFTRPPAFLLLNQYALNMTYNFLCNTASLPGVHERLIFVTLDTVARDELKRTWPDIRQFHWPTPSLYKPFSFAEGPYQTIYLLRANLAVALLRKGKSFWMMQQDTFWRKNLFELGFEDNTSYDAIFDQLGVDEKSMRTNWVNGANFFIRANNDTIKFFERLSDKLAHWYTPDMGVMIHQCHTWSRPRCAYFPYELAHSWEWMYSEQKNPPYIMQLDCETDGGSKLMQLGKFGFQFIDSNGTCDHEKVRLARERMEAGKIEVRRTFPSWGRLQFKAYWFIVEKAAGSENWSRPYTPTAINSRYFEVPIKIYEDGKLTQCVKQWKVGDKVEWRGPYPESTTWVKEGTSNLLLIAGGTGIAPFIRIIDEILEDDETEIRIRLLYCVRSCKDILFEEQLVEWSSQWNISVVICGSSLQGKLPYLFERIDKRFDEEVFLEQFAAISKAKPGNVTVSVCGSRSMEKDVVNFATKAGVESSKIIRFPG